MLSRIQNPCLWGYRINSHHLVHLMFSSAFGKTVYSRTNIKVEGVDFNLQDKRDKTFLFESISSTESETSQPRCLCTCTSNNKRLITFSKMRMLQLQNNLHRS